MRILYDGLKFATQQAGGISRYFANLISRLPATVEPWITTATALDEETRLHFPSHPRLHTRRFVRFRPRTLSVICELAYFRGLERYNRFDVAHPTYYQLLSRGSLRNYRSPTVITVYDMISELLGRGTHDSEMETARKERAVAEASRVICVSQHTKRDLIRLFRTPEEKIRVIYGASGLSFTMAGGLEPVPERPYFVFVGNHEARHKNFERLLRSFAQVVSRHRDVLLVVVGPPFTDEQQAAIGRLRLSRHLSQPGRVTDTHLAKLYHRSIALVYPSLYEGFGIPVLEAMACKTAVIASNRSSIPEVVGDAAILVEPENDDELAQAMKNLLEDGTRRRELIIRGHAREQLFTWENAAAATYGVYRELAPA